MFGSFNRVINRPPQNYYENDRYFTEVVTGDLRCAVGGVGEITVRWVVCRVAEDTE